MGCRAVGHRCDGGPLMVEHGIVRVAGALGMVPGRAGGHSFVNGPGVWVTVIVVCSVRVSSPKASEGVIGRGGDHGAAAPVEHEAAAKPKSLVGTTVKSIWLLCRSRKSPAHSDCVNVLLVAHAVVSMWPRYRSVGEPSESLSTGGPPVSEGRVRPETVAVSPVPLSSSVISS